MDMSPALPPMSRETIAALSTAPGRAAIAVIRISGPQAGEALDALAGPRPDPRRAALRKIVDPRDGRLIDRGLALWFPGPATATGEDLAELHLHGGRAVIAAALEALLAQPGLRLAEPGEFTRRAFLAGRMDLAEAEGFADLLEAETEAQRRQAILQSEGALSAVVDGWRDRLVGAMALIEAGIDFSDEDGVPAETRAAAGQDVEALAAEIAAALADTRAERLREGFRVALLGRPNAGKSSLLNALARREIAIVTELPGTTRDVIEARLDLAGYPVVVVDTAGLREAQDLAEQEGVRRAEAQGRAADLVLWLEDAAAPEAPPDVAAKTIWRIAGKADLTPARAGDDRLRLSVRSGEGLDDLASALGRAAAGALDAGGAPGLTRARQRDALGAVAQELETALAAWATTPEELLAERLRASATELGRVTGRIGVEEVLGRVFSSFCIGK